MKFRRRIYPHLEPYEFAALATYNAEHARGIVHTKAWTERMAEEQRRFNAQQAARNDGEDAQATEGKVT